MIKKTLTIIILSSIFLTFPLISKAEGNLYRNEQYYFSIVFPDNWKVEKGRNPNVVVKATSENGEGLESINILVKELPEVAQGVDITELAEGKDLLYSERQTLIGFGQTFIDNEKALWAESIVSYTAMDLTIYVVQYQVITVQGDNIFAITAGAGEITKDKAMKNYQLFEPLFKQTIGSFQFEDWNRTEVVNNNYSENGGTPGIITVLILSFVLTWGIGLSIPVLLRFVILKRPIEKKWAITVVIILWVLNFIIFVGLLESESKTHAALFLVALVSYWILRKGFKEKNNKI